MSIKAGFLTSTGNNERVYSSRELIKPFEYLLFEDKETPPYGIIPGIRNEFSCRLMKYQGDLCIGTSSGAMIVRNPEDQPSKKISEITDLYALEHNIIYHPYLYLNRLNVRGTSSDSRTFPDMSGTGTITQITYKDKNFFELFNTYRHYKTGEKDTILIKEVSFSLIKTDSTGTVLDDDSMMRYCYGSTPNLYNVSVVHSEASVEEFFYNCHNGTRYGDVRNRVVLGYVVGNLAYDPNSDHSDPTDEEIFNNAMYFYDCRKFAKCMIHDVEEISKYLELKKTILDLYKNYATRTINPDFTKSNSSKTIADSQASSLKSFLEGYPFKIFTKNGYSPSDLQNLLAIVWSSLIHGQGLSSVKLSDLSFVNPAKIQTYTDFKYSTGFQQYSLENRNIAYVSGHIVKIYGSIKYIEASTTYELGYNSFLMGCLPEDVPRPKHIIHKRSHCSFDGSYLLTIDPETGNLYASEIVRDGKWAKLLRNEWLHIEAFYIY